MPGTSAPHLGKRKRPSRPVSASSSDEPDEPDVHDAFRRAFEKRFAPLPSARVPTKPRLDTSTRQKSGAGDDELEDMRSDDDSDEFGGLSDDDDSDAASDEQPIQVVDATAPHTHTTTPATRPSDAKSFMSSKPPPPTTTTPARKRNPTAQTPSAAAAAAAEAEDDAAHKVNDLALHRLLTESHLLSAPAPSATLSHQPAAQPAGKPRSRRAAQLALRVAALGGKPAAPQRMPLAHARGIAARAAEREATRRREAREAGVVLERPASAKKKKERSGRRERGVGAPSVGRFEGGGTLRLSARDLRGLASDGDRRGKGGAKKGRRR